MSPRHDRTLPERYELVRLADGGPDLARGVVSLWTGQARMELEEAERRLSEVQFVAVEQGGTVAGLSTAYLDRHPQLGMELWHYRTFVHPDHRQSSLAFLLIHTTLERLEAAFASGEDTSAPGMVFLLQNRLLKESRNEAVWPTTGFVFVGENARGDHTYVRYFDGALVPLGAAS